MASGVARRCSSHPSLDEACGDAAVRADPESAGGVRGRDRASRCGIATSSWRAACGPRRAFLVARDGPGVPERLRGGARADERRHRCLAARPDPRGHRAVRVERSRSERTSSSCRSVTAEAGRAATIYRDAVWYPIGLPRLARAARARRPPLPDVPRAVAPRPVPARRHRPRPRRAPPSGGVQRVDAEYSRVCVPRVVRAATRVIAVSEFTKREVVELLACSAERIAVVPNGVDETFTPDGAAAEGDYVLAVATLEPRKNLARLARGGAAAREWSCASSASRLGRASTRRRRGLGCVPDDGAGARSTAARVRRLPVALRGFRHPGRGGDGVRRAGRHEPRAARRRRRPAARPCSSTRWTSARSPHGIEEAIGAPRTSFAGSVSSGRGRSAGTTLPRRRSTSTARRSAREAARDSRRRRARSPADR